MPRLDHRRRPTDILHPPEARPERLLQWVLQELNVLRTALHLPPLTWEEAEAFLRHAHSDQEGSPSWRN